MFFYGRIRAFLLAAMGISLLVSPWEAEGSGERFYSVIKEDWLRQERRIGREPSDPGAIADAYRQGERLLEDLSTMEHVPDLATYAEKLDRLKKRISTATDSDKEDRRALYFEIRGVVRDLSLRNPLLGREPIVFMKRRRFICQMLHEYLGYYYDYSDISGGGIYVLENPGYSMAVSDLIQERLPRGNYTTLSLSFKGSEVYFAFAKRAAEKPDFYSQERMCFQIYAVDTDGGNLHQLTSGTDDSFDPCPLPDGGIAFMSTRRGGFGRCHNPWEPLPAYTLHRMAPDGGNVRTLSYHETNEWHPSVLHDGRIVYTRWDYVDRSASNFHGLWTSNPDGTNPMALFGNYTMDVNACYQPKAIPGSDKIVFVAGAHHADVGGSLVVFDPAKFALDKRTGQDDLDALDVLTPEVCFPEAPGWPDSYFHSPWPLSENYYLVSFSFDPLPGMGPGVKDDTETGIYLFDRFGNLELLYREEGISAMYPIPLRARPLPPVIPSALDPDLGDEGEFVLSNVTKSHLALPDSRPVRELRVFQILPKSETHVSNKPRVGYANAESARMLLGTVPVEPDGSAYFRAPARKPLAFQAVDATGRAVQGMRSVTYLQPGERRGCVGCHEPRGTSPLPEITIAFQRKPSEITPGPDGSRPWSFLRLVQPVLDDHCVACHNGDRHPLDLTNRPAGEFTVSYESLRGYARWFEWGEQTIDEIVTRPGHMPADESPLTEILQTSHATRINLTNEELRRIYLWLDGNAAFYGTYKEEERLAQREGKAVPPPSLQ